MNPDQAVGGEPLNYRVLPNLGLLLLAFPCAAIAAAVYGIHVVMLGRALESILTALGILGGGAVILFLLGSIRIASTVDPAAREIRRTRFVLFIVPFGGGRVPFGKIRIVDFHHPSDGGLPEGFYSLLGGIHEGAIASAVADDATPFEIHIELQDRTRYFIARGLGNKRMADRAQKLARMIGVRLG